MSDSDPTASGAATEKLVRDDTPVPISVSSIPESSQDHRPTAKRRPLLGGASDNSPSPEAVAPKSAASPAPTSYIVKTNRPANQRRGKPVLKLLALIFLANILLVSAFGAWYYNKINDEIEARLTGFPLHRNGAPPSAKDKAGENEEAERTPTTPTTTGPEWQQLSDKVADLQAQLIATQRRLQESEVANKAVISKLEQISNAKPGTIIPSSNPAASSISEASSGNGQTPAAPLNDDLLLLKERNRLTAYADEAISTAAREPYDRLWKALNDPRLANLVHAARSEILRVQNYYLSGSRLDRYDIPVGEYYPDAASLRDAQLNDEQLIRLLSNLEHPWEVRLKAANLLGTRRSTSVGDALVKTIKSDPNLDVVKEATFSFEQITGYHAQLFESKELDAWWKQYNESADAGVTPNKAEKPAEEKAEQPKAPSKDDVKGKTKEEAPKGSSKSEKQPELKLPEATPGNF